MELTTFLSIYTPEIQNGETLKSSTLSFGMLNNTPCQVVVNRQRGAFVAKSALEPSFSAPDMSMSIRNEQFAAKLEWR
ncbi:hypothetical protein DMENIID0001_013410 [Sergentomyia squamirostris]